MDREIVKELYEHLGNDVFRLCMSYLGSRQDAEDICQCVFLKLLGGKVTLFPGKEKAWLLTAAANECKSHLRSTKRKNAAELTDTIAFEANSDRELYEAVMSIPPKYRAAIHLYYFEGYSQKEISEILRISQSAVQTRMSRARDLLRKELTDYEE